MPDKDGRIDAILGQGRESANHSHDIYAEENERLRRKLFHLRQAIIEAEPVVLVDGRFEEMMSTPTAIIDVAQALISARVQQHS